MISVVIATCDDERTLGQVLAALVPAAMGGLVREVILADAGSTDETLEIADDAGARVVQGEVAEACKIARGDWLLFLDADTPPPARWAEAVTAHINAEPSRAAWWGRGFLGFRSVHGLLTPRRVYEAQGSSAARAKRLKIS